mgnify:CR=1 FL=1
MARFLKWIIVRLLINIVFINCDCNYLNIQPQFDLIARNQTPFFLLMIHFEYTFSFTIGKVQQGKRFYLLQCVTTHNT